MPVNPHHRDYTQFLYSHDPYTYPPILLTLVLALNIYLEVLQRLERVARESEKVVRYHYLTPCRCVNADDFLQRTTHVALGLRVRIRVRMRIRDNEFV
jgi:hypothetical protein